MNLKLNCLVTGYLKQEFLKHNDKYQYPEALTIVFIQFLGQILFKFNAVGPKYKHYLDKAGQTFKIKGIGEDPTKLFPKVGSSYPFMSGIYTLTIKLTSDDPGNNPMGIINNIDVFKDDCHWIFSHALMYDNYTYAIYPEALCQSGAASSYGSNGSQSEVCKRWKKNDEVKFIINCNQWKLTYFVNEKQIGNPVNIAKDMEYYFIVCIQHWDKEYRIISFDHQH